MRCRKTRGYYLHIIIILVADDNRPVRRCVETRYLHLENVSLGHGAHGETMGVAVAGTSLGGLAVPAPRDVAVCAVDVLDKLRIGVIEIDCLISATISRAKLATNAHFILQAQGCCFLPRTHSTSRSEISVLCQGNLVPEAGEEGMGKDVAKGTSVASQTAGRIMTDEGGAPEDDSEFSKLVQFSWGAGYSFNDTKFSQYIPPFYTEPDTDGRIVR